MPTLNEIVYNVRNLAEKGYSNRSYSFSDRNIAYWAKYCRNLLVYQDLEKNKDINKQFEQDFGCIKLERVDAANCTEIKWGEDVLVAKIPKLLDLKNNAGLTYFGLIDKVTRIPTSMVDDILIDYAPYKRKKGLSVNIIGSNAYVRGNLDLCYVNIRGVADDPTKIQSCGEDNVVTCYDWDKDCYPIPSHLEKVMYDLILQQVFQTTMRTENELENKEVPAERGKIL